MTYGHEMNKLASLSNSTRTTNKQMQNATVYNRKVFLCDKCVIHVSRKLYNALGVCLPIG